MLGNVPGRCTGLGGQWIERYRGLNVPFDKPDRIALTASQRKLVDGNLGLIAVHLKRFVRNLGEPRRDREWDDLFQEGCLGLMQAAVAYCPKRGIPFAAFALPRIHNAVSRALHNKFCTIYVPPRRPKRNRNESSDTEEKSSPEPPKVYLMTDEMASQVAARHEHSDDYEDQETVGSHLRSKYERAVATASERMCTRTSTRGDRDKLVRVLAEERFLIPHDESKRALRQIARETSSSYARVAQCDKQFGEAIRAALESDPEFRVLQAHAHESPTGHRTPMDSSIEREMVDASTQEFTKRFDRADTQVRAGMLERLLTVSSSRMEEYFAERFGGLPRVQRERLMQECSDLPEPTKSRRKSRVPSRNHSPVL